MRHKPIQIEFLMVFACFMIGKGHAPHALAQDTASSSTHFRPGHHITGEWGLQQSHWWVGQMGDVNNETIRRPFLTASATYTFHMNIVKKLGWLVGTSCGVAEPLQEASPFRTGTAFYFPSARVGLVQNFLTHARVMATFSYQAQWFPFIKVGAIQPQRYGVIPDAFSTTVAWESFYTKHKALGAQISYRQIKNPCLRGCLDNTALGQARFKAWEVGLQLTHTWHVTELSQ